MSLKSLIGNLVGETLIAARVIKYKGNEKEFHFRELNGDEAETAFGEVSKDDASKNKGLRNRILAATWCDPDGNPIATAEEIGAQVPVGLANKLQQAALDVNGLIEDEADVKNA